MRRRNDEVTLAEILRFASNDTLAANGLRRRDVDTNTAPAENSSPVPTRKPTRSGKKPRRESEHKEQVLLFQLLKANSGEYPDLAKAFAIPNGGQRHLFVAAKLKAEGVKAGSPDICLPVARCGFHGFWGEMKVGKNDLTEHQQQRFNQLSEDGYLCVVQWSAEAMLQSMIAYVKGEIECQSPTSKAKSYRYQEYL